MIAGRIGISTASTFGLIGANFFGAVFATGLGLILIGILTFGFNFSTGFFTVTSGFFTTISGFFIGTGFAVVSISAIDPPAATIA